MDRSKAHIFAIANHKGGVGKTTTAAALGSIFAEIGIDTLLIDLDPQCNLTDTFLSQEPEETAFDLFKTRVSPRPIRVREHLDIIPAHLDMSALDLIIGQQFERELILKDALDQLEGNWEMVIMDCPPALNTVTVNALATATEVYVPIVPEIFPLKGLIRIQDICHMVSSRINPGICITGIVLTKYNPTMALYREVEQSLKEDYPDVLFNTKIRQNIRLAESPGHNQDIMTYAPNSNGAQDYACLAEEILQRLEAKEHKAKEGKE
jgi:chromosome partitioning protein